MAPPALDRARFDRVWSRLDAVGGSTAAFEELAAAYGEPDRAYHNAEHIKDCLDQLDGAAPEPSRAVEAALWFHDAVYDPRRHDNEARSADLAEQLLAQAAVPGKLRNEVYRLILVTRHAEVPADSSAGLISDIDLSILGRSAAEFQEYERKIRFEYRWVPEEHYRQGRARILSGFLARPRLYYTPLFHDRYEESARRNLRSAIDTLAR